MTMEEFTKNYECCANYLKEIINDKDAGEDPVKIRWLVSFLHKIDFESTDPDCNKHDEVLKLTLDALTRGSLAQDNQILLSTALCVLVKNAFEPDDASMLLGECVRTTNLLKLGSVSGSLVYTGVVQDADFFRICLSCSILQYFRIESLKNFYSLKSVEGEGCKFSPFAVLFDFLDRFCREFTKLTYISFKLLVLWLNRLQDVYSHNLIVDTALVCYLKRILYIVNHNWENAIVGIRDKNVEVMKLVFEALPKTKFFIDLSNDIVNLQYLLAITLQEIPWRMKCKYFMLASILPKFGIREALGNYSNICSGLVFSLSHPHLVSAGADIYREILRVLNVDEWLNVFYSPLKEVIFGKDKVAKENLMSYWMPETLKAYPSIIGELLHDLESNINSSSLFPLLALLKIGRKSGILKWEQIDHDFLKKCVSHVCEEVRGEVFVTVCVSAKTTSCISQDEIDMVCTFLEENINGDSARLRQVIICSFKMFIGRLRNVYCLTANDGTLNSSDSKEENARLVWFLQWLNNFVIGNFIPGVNYQRRIGSLHLLRTVLDSNSGKTPSISTHKGKKSSLYTEMENLYKNEIDCRFKGGDVFNILLRCLMDPASDVRDTASLILKMHFVLHSRDLFPCLWEKALGMCNSSMFYEIESGVILAECLVHWVFCQESTSVSEERFPFIEVLLSLAEEQRAKLEENVLKGAMSSPVHGVVNVLWRIISNPNILAKLELQEAHINRLLNLVDGMITFALGVLSSKPNSVVDVAPSFAEMGIAIECAISENAKGLDECEGEELTGASELVLNCIWLNLKICCFVVSTLATILSQDVGTSSVLLKEGGVEYCGQLLIRVLMKCRHKGAIESAGKALSMFALFCTSNPKLKKLPMKLLLECLEHTLGRRDGRVSITRSSAGRSILVHKLVAADSKNIIPVCIPKLIEWAEVDCLPEQCNYETEDLPQTQALHFLRVIVQDSGVYQYISPFMSKIALVCFKNFSSGIWAIRNAALQLFGAVVPKLVGQKKGQEEDIVGSNVTVEELTAHYPELMNFLLQELCKLVENSTHESYATSSSLLPVLMLCSRLTVGIPQLHTDSFKLLMSNFESVFFQLLPSPNIAVRKSCAKAISAFTALPHLPEKIKILAVGLTENWPRSGNELHGKLLCIKTLMDRLEVDSHFIEGLTKKFQEIRRFVKECDFTSNCNKTSYFTRALIDELQDFTEQDINTVVIAANDNALLSCYPGFPVWINVSVDLIMTSCPENSLCHIIQECFQCCSSIREASLKSLMKRPEKTRLKESTKLGIFKHLVEISNTDVPISIMMLCLNCMLQFCLISSACIPLVELETVYVRFMESSNYGVGCSSVAISLVSCMLMRVQESDDKRTMMMKIAGAILERSAPNNLEEFRLHAARALSFLIPSIDQYQDAMGNENIISTVEKEIIISLLESAILLLQDENLDIRAEAATCVSTLKLKTDSSSPKEFQVYHPQACIKLLFTNILKLLPLEISLPFLWKHLTHELTIHDLQKLLHFQTIRNPFDHGIDNIFAEKIIITTLSDHTLKYIIEANKHALKVFRSLLLDGTISDVSETAATILSLTSSDELGKQLHEHADVFHAFVGIKSQLEITNRWNVKGSGDVTSLVSRIEWDITRMLNPI